MGTFNCCDRDEYGFCRKYSSIESEVPCPGNGDCDGYMEVEEDG